MGRIGNDPRYPIKENPVMDDTVIGTDSENNDKTVQFRLSSIVGNSGGNTSLPFPKVNISYGNGSNGDQLNPEGFVELKTMVDGAYSDNIPTEVYKFIVDMPSFEQYSEFNPVLLVDRYKRSGIIRTGKDRKSGYKHETEYHATLNGRNNEIPLTGERTIVDVNPETYFKLDSRGVSVSGGSQRGVNTPLTDGELNFVYLSFRLRLTIGDEVIESNSFRELKAVLYYRKTNIGLPDDTLNNHTAKIRYKFQ